jgi:hypothetical protein
MTPKNGLKTQESTQKKHIKICYHENLFKKSSFNIRIQKRDLLMSI